MQKAEKDRINFYILADLSNSDILHIIFDFNWIHFSSFCCLFRCFLFRISMKRILRSRHSCLVSFLLLFKKSYKLSASLQSRVRSFLVISSRNFSQSPRFLLGRDTESGFLMGLRGCFLGFNDKTDHLCNKK